MSRAYICDKCGKTKRAEMATVTVSEPGNPYPVELNLCEKCLDGFALEYANDLLAECRPGFIIQEEGKLR